MDIHSVYKKEAYVVGWIKKIPVRRLLLCGFIYTLISMFIRQVEAVLTMKYYQMPQYFGVWSKLMMPVKGPPPLNFFVTSTIFTFSGGVSLAIIYCYIREILPKSFMKRVLMFADLMIGTSFIFFTLPSYLMFNLPIGLIISWFISSFVILVTASYIFVKIIQ
jgi:hypothetical protein